jgi:hypothetical protein
LRPLASAILGVFVGLQPAVAVSEQVERFEVQGSVLFIDLDIDYYEDDWGGEGFRRDHKVVFGLLENNPAIDTVVLTGEGGSLTDALIIGHRISALGLRTEARGECLSACAVTFLGGRTRSLQKGAVLGFHRGAVNVADLRAQYEAMQEDMQWADEFAYAEWLYEIGQIDARNTYDFALMQGVDAEGISRMFMAGRDDMWRPTPEELIEYRIVIGEQLD